MAIASAAVLALLIASGLAAIELVTSKYPRTFFVLTPWHCWALYAYSTIYGFVAFGVTLALSSLVRNGTVQLQGIGLNNIWMQALMVGLTTKAFLHIRLFSATVGTQSVPIGIETIVQLFEPWLLKTIDIDEFNGVNAFLSQRLKKYRRIEDVRQRIEDNLPESLPEQERVAMLNDMAQVKSAKVAMGRYLRLMGKAGFDQVFPL